jgi:hypothetical protein
MKTRRDFIKSVAAAGLSGAVGLPRVESAGADSPALGPDATRSGSEDRRYWLSVLERIAEPVMGNLARRELGKNMPVETADPDKRRQYAHLEAFGRLLAAMAPWLDAPGLHGEEAEKQSKWIELTHRALDAATDPGSPDFMNFSLTGQPLVDTAYLAQGILRAPRALWKNLDDRLRRQVIHALISSRQTRTPDKNNWVMFAATVEAALLGMGEATVEDRLEGSLRRMLGWYAGDGAYGDGEAFHFDYYNSFVIHPMLVDVLAVLRRKDDAFERVYGIVLRRARRFAEVQERLIAPDGTFPSLGRSTTYRFGAFHALAQMALMHELPEQVRPSQVRCALTAVIRRMIEAPGTFSAQGWLRPGFYGHQPELAEKYITTGSVYLCSVGLIPLGLPAADPFWSGPPAPWTSQRLWSGELLPADHALEDELVVDVPTLSRG